MPSTVTDRLAGLTTSVAVKAPCRVATTGAITLSGEQTIDGVAVVEGDRVLVKDQSNQVTNGIYDVSLTAWSRALDFDGARDAVKGTTVKITEGTQYAAQWFNLSTANDVTIGTDNITWAPTYVSLTPVSSATESTPGIAEIATQAEVDGGADDARFVTPLKLKAHEQATPWDVGRVSTDAGATEGPTDELYRNSASPAAADLLGVRSWAAKSSSGIKRVFGKLVGRMVDATNASEDFALDIYTIIAGTLANRFSFGAGLYANGLSDMGAGTVNATAYYLSGSALSGKIVNRYYAEYTSNSDITTVLPADDTIPTSSEGAQVASISVTTTTATQRVRLTFIGQGGYSGSAVTLCAAAYRDTTCINAMAIRAAGDTAAANGIIPLSLQVEEVPGSASTFTYSVRVGPGSAGTMRLNGTGTARYFGGASRATVVIEVIEP